jgi:hypothetical protein
LDEAQALLCPARFAKAFRNGSKSPASIGVIEIWSDFGTQKWKSFPPEGVTKNPTVSRIGFLQAPNSTAELHDAKKLQDSHST